MRQNTVDVELRIVIPAYAAMSTLKLCIDAIHASFRLGRYEIVVVDDGSNPGLAALSDSLAFRVVSSLRGNASLARNAGVRGFRGDFIAFIDADVQVRPDAIEHLLAEVLRGRTHAAYGRYSLDVRRLSFFQQYKQLYLAQVYGRRAGPVEDFFWTAICVVTRTAFDAVNGFDSALPGHIGEDVDFGQRLTRAGYRVVNVPEATGKHLKPYCLTSLVRNDFIKGASTIHLSLRARAPLAHNPHARASDKVAVGLCLLSIVTAIFGSVGALASIGGWAPWAMVSASYLAVRHEFVVLQCRMGLRFFVRALPLMYLLDIVRVLSVAAGTVAYLFESRRVGLPQMTPWEKP